MNLEAVRINELDVSSKFLQSIDVDHFPKRLLHKLCSSESD